MWVAIAIAAVLVLGRRGTRATTRVVSAPPPPAGAQTGDVNVDLGKAAAAGGTAIGGLFGSLGGSSKSPPKGSSDGANHDTYEPATVGDAMNPDSGFTGVGTGSDGTDSGFTGVGTGSDGTDSTFDAVGFGDDGEG